MGYFSFGSDVRAWLEVLADPVVAVADASSVSRGAGGGVVNIVQPIHPVIPRIASTASMTGISIRINVKPA